MANTSVIVSNTRKPLCFVIGPIGEKGTNTRKHADLLLYAIIKYVLDNGEFQYQVKRADEDSDPGMIGDRIIADILHADLVVADLTNLNVNAFYELGIRHATEKPTIHIAGVGTVLPFDNIGHRTIFIDVSDWYSIEAGRGRLLDSVRAINQPGFKVSNPLTQANASFKMRQSADPRDRVIADLQERLLSVESQVSESIVIGKNKKPLVNSSRKKKTLTIDTSNIFKEKNANVLMDYNEFSGFGELLDIVFFILSDSDKKIQAFHYDIQWYLQGKNGRRFATGHSPKFPDLRSLEDVGIYPGDILYVQPLEPI